MVVIPKDATPFVCVHNVTKDYAVGRSTLRALTGVSLHVKEGEIVSIVGPSGCGKTTLLKIIAGLIAPTDGFVEFGGKQVVKPLREIGFMPQFPTLLPWRNAVSNVLLPAEVNRNFHFDELHQKSLRLLKEVGLASFEEYYPQDLSGGMQQRVSLARALLLQPPLLLLDEPFGALDEPTRRDLSQLVSTVIACRRLSCIFVSHDVDEAVSIANRVLVFSPQPGRMLDEVTVPFTVPRSVDDLLSDPQFVSLVGRVRKLLFAAKGR